jgi:hypothetical protein
MIMTLPSQMFTGPIIAEKDISSGEPVELTEAQARWVYEQTAWPYARPPIPWESTFTWKATSAGFKKGEVVVLQTFEVYEGEE